MDINEGGPIRKDTIPNRAIEFHDIDGGAEACWHSKYVNTIFHLMVDISSAVALKLTDPNCMDPDLSRLANDEVITMCDGTTATGSLDLANLQGENVKVGVVVGGVLGTVLPSPAKCQSDAAIGCVTTAGYPAAEKKSLAATDIRVGKTIAGIAGTYAPDFPDAANVYNDTVNGIAGTLTLPLAASVRTGNGAFGPASNGVIPTLGDCASDGAIGCVAVAEFKAADMTKVIPSNIKSTVSIAGVSGAVLPPAPSCAADGADNCVVDGTTYKAATLAGLANKLLSGQTVAGLAGNVTLPDAGDVYAGIAYGVAGTGFTGTLTVPTAANVRTGNGAFGQGGTAVTPTLADCADGGSGCVAVGPLQAAATVAGSASKILSGQSVAGISGNVTLPAVGKVLTGIQFGVSGTGQTGTLTLPTAGNVLTGSGTYGDPGVAVTPSLSPDYPSVGNVLSTDTVNSVAGTLTLPAVGDVNSGVPYGVAGSGSTGTLTLPTPGNVLSGSGTFGNPGAAITPILNLPIAANVKSGTANYGNPGSAITPAYSPDFPAVANVYNDTSDGVAGTLTLPVVGNVYTGIAYGVAGTGSTGTLTVPTAANVRTGNGAFGQGGTAVTPTLGNCSVDGAINCVAVAGYKAANMANVVAAKIKSGVTIAGVLGGYPSSTNPLAGADATADLDFVTFDAKIKAATSFEWFDSSGTRHVNSGDADIVSTNISSTANIFGTQGTVSAPTTPNAWDIRIGQTINGVAGQLKVACRNSLGVDMEAFHSAVGDSTTDTFTAANHVYELYDSVRFIAWAEPAGLTADTITYYVRNPTLNTFQLALSPGGPAIDFTTNGAEVAFFRVNDGNPDIWDTVDDYHSGTSPFTAAATPQAWTSDNFCGGVGTAASAAVWTDSTPDGVCNSLAEDCVFKDKITGLDWSELLSASASWVTAVTTCADLDFADKNGWHLPTEKELLGAYEHGIYSAQTANWITGAQLNDNFWSSTTVSTGISFWGWRVSLADGETTPQAKEAHHSLVCVR